MKKRVRRKPDQDIRVRVHEAAVLELLREHPNTQFTCSLVAQKLGGSPPDCLAVLKALHARRAIRGTLARVGMPVFFALPEADAQVPHGRGDLRADHNGAQRHWALSMSIRRA